MALRRKSFCVCVKDTIPFGLFCFFPRCSMCIYFAPVDGRPFYSSDYVMNALCVRHLCLLFLFFVSSSVTDLTPIYVRFLFYFFRSLSLR